MPHPAPLHNLDVKAGWAALVCLLHAACKRTAHLTCLPRVHRSEDEDDAISEDLDTALRSLQAFSAKVGTPGSVRVCLRFIFSCWILFYGGWV